MSSSTRVSRSWICWLPPSDHLSQNPVTTNNSNSNSNTAIAALYHNKSVSTDACPGLPVRSRTSYTVARSVISRSVVRDSAPGRRRRSGRTIPSIGPAAGQSRRASVTLRPRVKRSSVGASRPRPNQRHPGGSRRRGASPKHAAIVRRQGRLRESFVQTVVDALEHYLEPPTEE